MGNKLLFNVVVHTFPNLKLKRQYKNLCFLLFLGMFKNNFGETFFS